MGLSSSDSARRRREKSAHATPFALGVACVLAHALVAGCGTPDAPARPQLIIQVDTDTVLVGQLPNQTEISPALAVDTVRVDVVGDDREVKDYRDFTAPDALDWPLSFGVAAAAGTVRLRIRAFRASLATRGSLGAVSTIEPQTNLLIDRLVELPQPDAGIRTVRITLAAACFGAPVSFQQPLTTCIDRNRRVGSPTESIVDVTNAGPAALAASLVGTAPEVREVPCANPPRTSAVCIPGGPSILGDIHLTSLVEGPPTAPVRPVILSPFHMDRTEFTVGRYRALLNRKSVTEEPQLRDPGDFLRSFCTWRGAQTAEADSYPLNCVSYAAAKLACEVEGGALPTEAQWEHAARGRGRSFNYPWGDAEPKCCSASVSRPPVQSVGECSGMGVEPVTSHVGKGCEPEDISPDGVIDLAGGLREIMNEGGLSFADSCWSLPGLVLDPRCNDAALPPGKVSRGGDWSAGSFLLRPALRSTGASSANTTGFRCVYKDGK